MIKNFMRGRQAARAAVRAFALVVSLFAGSAAIAQTQTVSLYLDRDALPGTGCTANAGGLAMTGIDVRIDVALTTGATPQVDAITAATCSAGSFIAAGTSGATGSYGIGTGPAGLDVLELGMPETALIGPRVNSTFAGIVTSGSAGADAMSGNGLIGGAPGSSLPDAVPIPSVGVVALLLLMALVMVIGVRASRNARRWTALSLFGFVAVAGVALAANFVVDGQIGDWAGEPQLASSPANAGADLRAAFIARERGLAFVRVDLTGLRTSAPAFTSTDTSTFDVGSAGSFAVTASGLPAPTLALTGGTLPSGIAFDAATGMLAGTPSAATGGSYALEFTATNAVDSTTQSFTLLVHQAPEITSAGAATFQVGTAGSFAATATGFPAPAFVLSGALPAGMVFDGPSGVLSGTPQAGSGGSYLLSLVATNAAGSSAPQTFTLTIDDAPVFTSAAATSFTVGQAGSFNVSATGTPSPTLALTGGTLPAGVSFDAGTGVLSGTPESGTGGVRMLQFTASNVRGDTTQAFSLTVNQSPTITSSEGAVFNVGAAGSFTVTADGFPAPTFTLTGALPSGVSFDTAGGVLAGTPASGAAGSYPLSITAGNVAGNSAPQAFTLLVNEGPAFTSAANATFVVGEMASFAVTASGTPAPTIALTSGTLPGGVNFDAATGLLSGTAEAAGAGTHALEFTASNAQGSSTQAFTLTVHLAPTITSANATTFDIGVADSFTATADGFPAPTFTLTGALPGGVSFDQGSGMLAGTAAANSAGDYPLTLVANNAAGASAPQAFTLTVQQSIAFTSADSAIFTVGQSNSFNVTVVGFPTPTLVLGGDPLPDGVVFDASTGVLSGTPSAGMGGEYTLQFTASNGVDSDSQFFTLAIHEAPSISSADAATLTVAQLGSFTASATGFPSPTFTLGGVALPSGLSFDAATGVLAGTPATGTGGTYALTLTAGNAAGSSPAQSFTLTVQEAPAFTSAASTTMTVGSAGSFAISASGFPTPVRALSSGTLPADVGFDGSALTGTPADGTGGLHALAFSAQNAAGIVTQNFTLTVNELPQITSANAFSFTAGAANSFTVTADGYPAGAFSIGGDALPAGVSFDGSTGVLAGNPAATAAGVYNLVFTATNVVGASSPQAFALTIQGEQITSADLHTCLIGDSCPFTFTATGAPTGFGIIGTLPTALTLDPATGQLSGTLGLTDHGIYPVTVRADYAGGVQATQAFTLRVGPLITSVSPSPLLSGQAATVSGFGFSATPASNTLVIDGQATTIDAATTESLTVTVPCIRQGVYPLRNTVGGKATPDYPHPTQGAVQHTVGIGEALLLSDAASLDCTELTATGVANTHYVVSVFNAGTSPTTSTGVQLSGDSLPDSGDPLPARESNAALLGPAFSAEEIRQRNAEAAHLRVLEGNVREYERIRAVLGPAKKTATAKAIPEPTRLFRVPNINVAQFCNNYYVVSATRVYYDGKLAIYEDDATPAGLKVGANATMADYVDRIGDQFNADMEPIIRNNFGDVLLRDDVTDNNDVLIALFTPLINTNFSGVAGFVTSCDQFANDDAASPAVGGSYTGTGANGSSNFGEVFYAYQPTSTGAGFGTVGTADYWYRTIRSTFIHETKHVASQAARVAGGAPLEIAWLEEGTARHSEELWMRDVVDNQAWKSNIGYGSVANPINIHCDVRPDFAECLANPRRPAAIVQRHFTSMYTQMFGTNARLLSPFGRTPSDNASYFYAVSWSLVRHAIDRYGASDAAFLTALTQGPETGVDNLVARAGNVPIDRLLGGWSLSLAVDDHPLAAVAPSLDVQFPTWNLRGIYTGLNADFPGTYTLAYPLLPTSLGFGHFAPVNTATMYGGGMLWYQLTGTQTEGQLLKLKGNAGAARNANLRMAITRVR